MKALLLDLGNSRWKAALAENGELLAVEGGGHADAASLIAWVAGHALDAKVIWLSSVIDAKRTAACAERVNAVLPVNVRQARSTDPMPNIRSGYRKPEQLGVDRLMAMVAARAQFREPLCVVDAGSAVTIDFIDEEGQHLGGFILPGERMFRDCLLANTSIPRDPEVEAGTRLGRDTATAVSLGGRYAVAGIVEMFTDGSAALFPGRVVRTVVGGGDAEQVVSFLPSGCTKLDHLVLRGLAVLAAGCEE